MVNKLSKACIALTLLFTFESALARTCQSINISAHPNYPPFHWKDGDRLTGASIEISKQIFNSLGVKTNVLYEGPWKRVLQSAKAGKIDFIPALKMDYERSQYLVFTKTEFELNPVAVFVRKDSFEQVTKLNDLQDRFGSINAGDRHGADIDSFIDSQANMQSIQGIAQNFDMLRRNRTDYFITGWFVGMDYIRANKLEHEFDVALKFDGTVIHNAFSKPFAANCQVLVRAFEQKLVELKSQGRVKQAIYEFNELWLQSMNSANDAVGEK